MCAFLITALHSRINNRKYLVSYMTINRIKFKRPYHVERYVMDDANYSLM